MRNETSQDTWTLKRGDNPSSIARKLYPDAPKDLIVGVAMQIMEANSISRPERLQPGEVLLLPDPGLEVTDETRAAYAADSVRMAALMETPEVKGATGYGNLYVIGGGFDGYGPDEHRSEHAANLAAQYPGSRAFTHARVQFDQNSVIDEISARYAEDGRPVDLVGHSWGGPEAYGLGRELVRRGVPVRHLVTADPVGWFRQGGLPEEITWINISADPRNSDSQDNRVAELGGKPSALPIRQADINGVVAADHRDLAGMISSDLTLPEERSILDRVMRCNPDIDGLENPGTTPSVESYLLGGPLP